MHFLHVDSPPSNHPAPFSSSFCSSRIRNLEEEIKKHVKKVDELKVLCRVFFNFNLSRPLPFIAEPVLPRF
jgi:hypothetical protein